MGKIAVIAGGDEEHSHDENRQTSDQIGPMKREKENAEREEMNRRKRNRLKNGNAGSVRQGYRPIARERSHPALFLRGIQMSAELSRSGDARELIFSVETRRKWVN